MTAVVSSSCTVLSMLMTLVDPTAFRLAELVNTAGMSFVVLVWYHRDRLALGYYPERYPFNVSSLFLSLYLPWYALRTRGLAGLLTMGFFIIIYVFFVLISAVIWTLAQPLL